MGCANKLRGSPDAKGTLNAWIGISYGTPVVWAPWNQASTHVVALHPIHLSKGEPQTINVFRAIN